ncbi:MAG: phosphodiester glycosidase family protein [Lachnospiraceae bacterium]|nr:phosphodiester glycosidase family protein [Lachnospiraceae bacterium]
MERNTAIVSSHKNIHRGKKQKHSLHPKHLRRKRHTGLHIVITLFTCLFLILVLFFGSTTIVCLGPSVAARDLFVSTVMETSAAKFLARIYFSEDKINEILAANTAKESNVITDVSAVTLPSAENSETLAEITVEDVKGSTFIGKMMIVNDPSRLYVATVPNFNESASGMLLTDMVSTNGAEAGINGGAFEDVNGVGKGGMPLGVVIQNGVITCNSTPESTSVVIGFDSNHKLIVGNMSAAQAIASGMQEGVSFGPALVINGERVPITGSGGGLNPRTAIGQRSDGAVLLLVIDGRQAQSLGASFKDVADVMLEYGAVNAGNLDGGSSSMMIWNNEVLNNRSNLIGPRKIPTAFLVHPAG